MPVIPLSEAKARLSALVHELEAEGKRYTITRNGRPVARLVPLAGGDDQQAFGMLAHYADSAKRARENEAWKKAAEDKHAHRS